VKILHKVVGATVSDSHCIHHSPETVSLNSILSFSENVTANPNWSGRYETLAQASIHNTAVHISVCCQEDGRQNAQTNIACQLRTIQIAS